MKDWSNRAGDSPGSGHERDDAETMQVVEDICRYVAMHYKPGTEMRCPKCGRPFKGADMREVAQSVIDHCGIPVTLDSLEVITPAQALGTLLAHERRLN